MKRVILLTATALLWCMFSDANYGKPAASIMLLSPNDGEEWLIGQTQEITWTTSGCAVHQEIRVELRRQSTGLVLVLTFDTFNDGTMDYTPTSNLPTANDYFLRARCNSNGVTDETDGTFTISQTPPSATFSEDFESGVIQSSVWTTFGSPSPAVVSPGFESNFAFDASGDSFCDSGVESTGRYIIEGSSLSFDGKVSSTFAHFQDVSVAVAGNSLRGGSCAGLRLVYAVDIRIHGNLNDFFVEYRILGETHTEPIDGDWHSYEMRFLESGHVEFYRDNKLDYTSTTTLDYSEIEGQNLSIGGRSHSSSPVLIDNVELSPTSPPTPPSLSLDLDATEVNGEVNVSVAVTNDGGPTSDDLVLHVTLPENPVLHYVLPIGFGSVSYNEPGECIRLRNNGDTLEEDSPLCTIPGEYPIQYRQLVLESESVNAGETKTLTFSFSRDEIPFAAPGSFLGNIHVLGRAELQAANDVVRVPNTVPEFEIDQTGYPANMVVVEGLLTNQQIPRAKIAWIGAKYVHYLDAGNQGVDNNGDGEDDPHVSWDKLFDHLESRGYSTVFANVGTLNTFGQLVFPGDSQFDDAAVAFLGAKPSSLDAYAWINAPDPVTNEFLYETTDHDFGGIITEISSQVSELVAIGFDGIVLDIEELLAADYSDAEERIIAIARTAKLAAQGRPVVFYTFQVQTPDMSDPSGLLSTDVLKSMLEKGGVDYVNPGGYDYGMGAKWGLASESEYANRIRETIEVVSADASLAERTILGFSASNLITPNHSIYETFSAGRFGWIDADENNLAGVSLFQVFDGSIVDFAEWDFVDEMVPSGLDLTTHTSTEAGFDLLTAQISTLLDLGSLQSGLANSLMKKLEGLEEFIEQGKPKVAVNRMGAFVRHACDLIAEGQVDSDVGHHLLIGPANSLLAQLGEDPVTCLENVSPSLATETNQPKVRVYPNPFNPTSNIAYTLPTDGHASVVVYDVLGRKVRTLVDQRQMAGRHTVRFVADGLSSGVYIYRVSIGDRHMDGTMMLSK